MPTVANPNSAHQTWSKWIITIRPGLPFAPEVETVRTNTARFIRKGFGSAGQFRIRRFASAWVVDFLVEADRHPDDPETFRYFARSFTDFFRNGFGPGTQVHVKARLMAGQRLDGRPPDQIVIMPAAPLLN